MKFEHTSIFVNRSRRKYQNLEMTQTTMGEMWARMGSSIAGFIFMWAVIQQYFPYEFRQYLERYTHRLISFASPYIKISIHEFTGDKLKRNEAYVAVEAYLSENSSRNAKNLKAEMGKNSSNLVLSMDDHEMCTDDFCGIQVSWSLNKIGSSPGSAFYRPEPEKRYYRLMFHKRYRELITDSYLGHVMKYGKAIKMRNRQRKLFTNSPGHKWPSYKHTMWSYVVFEHPASFQTLAMDPDKKKEIVDDLLHFSKSKDYYAKIGKAWKRGYLLYGPPGTGKSTMIAAIAKLLDYDVYDLELTAVKDNTELRKLLIETSNKSILVIEDIDCSLDLTGQRKKSTEKLSDNEHNEGKRISARKEDKEERSSKVTLSGLLNFIDGLWSSCGEERLVVFTTNYFEKLDPALIRRGRMDKHIKLSYCSFEAFKVLARNYLDLEWHPLFKTIHELIDKNKMTPADVAENLMPKSTGQNVETCLTNLIQALEVVKEETIAPIEKEENKEEETGHPIKKKEEAIGSMGKTKEDATGPIERKKEQIRIKEEHNDDNSVSQNATEFRE